MKFDFTKDDFAKAMIDKYINDIVTANKDEIYAIFEIINNQYKESGKCPICNEGYGYNNKIIRVEAKYGHFIIADGDSSYLTIQANYCPICGKSIKE